MGAQPDAAPPAAQTAASSPLVGDAGGDSPYIPRPELSIPPVPQAPVLLTAPPGQSEVSRISGILSLYIDEHGTVHHITASGEPMPPEFEQAARQAFMALTFRPGVLNGEPVKSRIRVEVVFDNTPLPPAEQPSGASAPR
ncbi:MAG: energy transducer TonB [Acidobacteriota bacterium]